MWNEEQNSGFRDELRSSLANFGFARQADRYIRKLNSDVIACIEARLRNVAAKNRCEVDIAVGVQHQTLEQVIVQLKARPTPSVMPFSIGVQIGYLMPKKAHVSYLLARGANPAGVAQRIASDVHVFGLSFMQANSTLRAICNTISNREISIPLASAAYRLPIALYLLGDPAAALATHMQFLDSLAAGNDVWAREYKAFSKAFRSLMATV